MASLRVRLRLCATTWLVFQVASLAGQPASFSAPVSLGVSGRSDSTPWIAARGSFVAVTWGASAAGKSDVFLAVSRDGGATFGSPVQVNAVAGEARLGGELPPRVALTATRGSSTPTIAVLWTARGDATHVKSAKSRDGGRTFDAPVTLQAAGAAGDRGWPALTFDQGGDVHAIWLDHRGLAAGLTATGHAGHQSGAAYDGVAMAQQSGLYYASVSGTRPSERELAKGVCYCCKTALAAGPDGTLFAAWRHVYPGNLRDIAMTISRDGGRTFSAPARVSEDGWSINGCPDDGPAIAVEATGNAHLVWPTVIDGPTPQGGLFYASTRDGARFTPRVRIPTLGGRKPAHPHIVADTSGRIFVAWDETIGRQRIAAFRELKLQPDRPAMFGEIVRLSPVGAALHPVLAATDKGLVAVWATGGDPSRIETRTIRIP
jgi:hypothetical protein